jgi:hypothetical protein
MAAGMTEAEIQRRMLTWGFGNVTPKQFLKAKTVQQAMQLIEPMTRVQSN